jgi:hypothetical protein
MKSGNKRLSPFNRQRVLLSASIVWLQALVIIFVIVQIQRSIRTPVSQWVDRAIYLLTGS